MEVEIEIISPELIFKLTPLELFCFDSIFKEMHKFKTFLMP